MASKNEARFTADTTDFTDKVNRMSKDLEKFGKGGVSSLGGVAGAFGKLVPAIGAAVGAYDLFDRAISSSQTLTDAWGGVVESAKTITNEFAYAIANFDFTTMEQGLTSLTIKAQEYYAAMDQLANTTMSYGAITAKENLYIQQQMLIAKDATKSLEERQKALENITEATERLKSAGGVMQGDLLTAMQTKIASSTTLDASMVSWEAIERAVTVNAHKNRAEVIAAAKADYEAYKKEVKALQKSSDLGYYMLNGNPVSKGYAANYTTDMDKINRKYADQIVMWAAIEKYGDDALNVLTEQVKQYYAINQQTLSIEQSTMRTNNALTNRPRGGGGGRGSKPSQPTALDYIDDLGNKYDPMALAEEAIAARGALQIPIEFVPIEEDTTMADIENDAAIATANTINKTKELQKEWDKLQHGFKNNAVGDLTSAFNQLGGAIGGTAGALMQFVAGMADQIASGAATIASMKAQEAEHRANMTAALGDAAAGAMAAHSAIPFVGVAIGIGMVASIVAALMSLPKFAKGGIATSPTLGLFGEAGPEAIIPLRQLPEIIAQSNRSGNGGMNGKVEFLIHGQDLYGVYNAEYSSRSMRY